jgi:tetratricopeptide (TPR) repeat protein
MFEQKVQHPGHSVLADIVITSKLRAMCATMHRLWQCVAASRILGEIIMTIRPQAAEFLQAKPVNDSSDRFRPILEAILASRGNLSRDIDTSLAADPDSLFGHCLRAAIIVRGDDARRRSAVAESVNAIEAISRDVNSQARRHASAARAWLEGDHALALERYGAIIVDFPRDILALVVAHALDFRLGFRRMLRDRIAQVLPEWHVGMPGYASVLAMYAFGLEENGQFGRAEKVARRALQIDPRHPGAVHVIVHAMEMQGRGREGLEFLAANEPAWTDTSFAVHLAWHRALFHLDADDAQSALAVYDAQIARSRAISELADASALLWRLQLAGLELGERWSQLADLWNSKNLADARPFYIAHAMMAFAAARRRAGVRRIFGVLQRAETKGVLALHPEERLFAPLCEALIAFASGDYARCVERLETVRHIAHECGGSHAQCDIVQLTLVEAALRASKANLARALVAERTAQKPFSRLNRQLQRRLIMAA